MVPHRTFPVFGSRSLEPRNPGMMISGCWGFRNWAIPAVRVMSGFFRIPQERREGAARGAKRAIFRAERNGSTPWGSGFTLLQPERWCQYMRPTGSAATSRRAGDQKILEFEGPGDNMTPQIGLLELAALPRVSLR